MAGINDFLSVQAPNNKINRNDKLKNTTVKNYEKTSEKAAKTDAGNKDQAQISDTARNLLNLRMDAKKYLDEVKQGEPLSENDIEQLKQKIENKYFISEDVIDKIVDKLTNLPNYLKSPFNT